jgi:hypothetical protein
VPLDADGDELINIDELIGADENTSLSEALLTIHEHFVTLKDQLDSAYQEHNIRSIVRLAKRVKLFEKVMQT